MTRCGIGPKFSIITILFGALAGWLTNLSSDWFVITCISFWVLVIIGISFLVSGIALYVYSLSVFNRGYRNKQLVTSGPFSVVRHPIYAAWIFLICPGTVMFFNSWLMLLVPLVAYITFKVCIHNEEDYLKDEFGQAYLDYKSKTNEIFPKCGFWRDDREMSKEY